MWLVVSTSGVPGCWLVRPNFHTIPYDRCEATLRGEKAPTQIQARHQFWTSRKIGYATQLNCWCGASIPVDYSRGYVRQTNAVVTFADDHAECQPKVEEQAS